MNPPPTTTVPAPATPAPPAYEESFAYRAQAGFRRQMARLHARFIPPGERVLEWGCGVGDLLAALQPGTGLGLDADAAHVASARRRHAGLNCEFREGRLPDTPVEGEWDHIILNYLPGYLTDVQAALESLRANSHPRTRLYISSLNHVWYPLIKLAAAGGAVVPRDYWNWLSMGDLANLLDLTGWEVVLARGEQLFPFEVPLLEPLCNRFLARLPGLSALGMTVFIVARPRQRFAEPEKTSLSVVVPMRNEEGNVAAALARIPALGRATEVIFVEGNSRDKTWEALQRAQAEYRGPLQLKICRQPGKGKWDAVRHGFAQATGDILVIQDGDLTAPPEDLPKFFDVLCRGTVEFANGSRLVYPMENQAMRFLNMLGNHFFANALSFVLSQRIKDSLCGTKMMARRDYERLLKRLPELGDFDPFGDFNLLFGSALMGLRIRDVPVRYKNRTYGETNISRFRHGWILLKMTFFGLRKIRFR
jgi:SAM-dependent methyltransferase